jgi:signal transduction histidine kinase
LSGLVYDVLDHQNLVEGKVIIDMKPTKISDILRDIHSTYQYDAVQKGLEFELIIRDELDKRSYLTDALRLSQIVINLVTNATKYTVSGKIVLEAGLTGKESRDLEIRVSDTGIGIKPENLEKINDRYFRVEEGLSGRENGYGLGLSIVKQLTALFGGTLSASSEMGACRSVGRP